MPAAPHSSGYAVAFQRRGDRCKCQSLCSVAGDPLADRLRQKGGLPSPLPLGPTLSMGRLCPLSTAPGLKGRRRRHHFCDQATGGGGGVHVHVEYHHLPVLTFRTIQELGEVGGRAGHAVHLGRHEDIGLTPIQLSQCGLETPAVGHLAATRARVRDMRDVGPTSLLHEDSETLLLVVEGQPCSRLTACGDSPIGDRPEGSVLVIGTALGGSHVPYSTGLYTTMYRTAS